MRIKRYIAGLLFICFSAFLGHNLVPHHHHSEVFHSPVATSCPFEHGDHHEHNDSDTEADSEEHPIHCHAFNDVVFKKIHSSVNQVFSAQVQHMLVPFQVLVPELPPVKLSKHYSLLKLPCSSHTDYGTRALRAPPAFT
jgi:hypothetical protein